MFVTLALGFLALHVTIVDGFSFNALLERVRFIKTTFNEMTSTNLNEKLQLKLEKIKKEAGQVLETPDEAHTNRGKYKLGWEKFVVFVNKYHDDRKAHLSALDGMMNAATTTIRSLLKSEIPTFSLEETNTHSYLCTNFGKVGDLKTITKSGPNKYEWIKDGSVDITIYYEIGKFQVNYGTFYEYIGTKSLGVDVRGGLKIRFRTAKLSVKVNVVSWLAAIKAIKEKKGGNESREDDNIGGCVVFLKRFTFDKLEGMSLIISSDSVLVKGSWLGKLANSIKEKREHLKHQMQANMLMELYNKLPHKPVCKHEDFIKQAREYDANKRREFTQRYDENCSVAWKSKKDKPEILETPVD